MTMVADLSKIPQKPLCRRIVELPPSMTQEMTLEAQELKMKWNREGIDKSIHAFSIGEPDFDTPPHIVDAASEATRSGKTHYTPSLGIMELRAAVAAKCRRENGIPCTAEDVLITPCKLGIYAAIQVLVDLGDTVLVPDPGWVSYDPMVRMAGAESIYIPLCAEGGFQVTGDLIREHARENTKAVIINSPSNPTGGVITRENIRGIAEAVVDLDLYVISDEIYEMIHYLNRAPKSLASLPGLMKRTVTANGFSKAYAMTGWRVGYIIAPPPILRAMNKVQQHTLTCTSSVAQYAALAAITGPHAPVLAMVETFRARRDYLVKAINSIEGLNCPVPDGAFYAFFSYDVNMSSLNVCRALLEKEGIALTPGRAFGPSGEGFIRMSYAASMDLLREGVERLAKGYAALRAEKGVKDRGPGCDA